MPVKKASKKTVHTISASAFDAPAVSKELHKEVGISKKLILILGTVLTLCVIVGFFLYYYLQYQQNQKLLKNPLLASEREQETVVSKVGQLTQLPTGEAPTIAKVTDTTKLRGQQFFQHARNGDYVLIYSKAKEAILYDPDGNKIIQVGPISLNQPVAQQAALGAQTMAQSIRVVIENGTTIAGLAKKTEVSLTQSMPAVTVVSEGNAVKQDYTQTIVVDLTGKNAAVASQLASVLKGTVGTLPSGEVKPVDADILVILGKNN
jgi:hypothetical protein